ncbi:MAG TPA: hypothetical protein IAC93_07515 [Candidatus Limisoma gallistercoris]|jgi:hypothetical protein|nr:hypothetical protein [Candidatus Limisoma gallistercoris]
MIEIPATIQELLTQLGSIDIAESEFKRHLNEDSDLKKAFKEWCEDMGYKEREAFRSYCEEYLQGNESIFDTLSDYNE